MMAVVNSNNTDASEVARAMERGFESAGVDADTYCTRPGKGVFLLEEK